MNCSSRYSNESELEKASSDLRSILPLSLIKSWGSLLTLPYKDESKPKSLHWARVYVGLLPLQGSRLIRSFNLFSSTNNSWKFGALDDFCCEPLIVKKALKGNLKPTS